MNENELKRNLLLLNELMQYPELIEDVDEERFALAEELIKEVDMKGNGM